MLETQIEPAVSAKKAKWFVYTVCVGLLPLASRLLVWAVTKHGAVEPFSPAELVAFGLILHISNINEIEHYTEAGETWKTVQNGTSILFIASYSMLFALALVGDNLVDVRTITYCTIAMAVISLGLSWAVFDRISRVTR